MCNGKGVALQDLKCFLSSTIESSHAFNSVKGISLLLTIRTTRYQWFPIWKYLRITWTTSPPLLWFEPCQLITIVFLVSSSNIATKRLVTIFFTDKYYKFGRIIHSQFSFLSKKLVILCQISKIKTVFIKIFVEVFHFTNC